MYRSRAEQFVNDAVQSGKFDSTEIIEIVFDESQGQDQFASEVVFLTVKLKLENATEDMKVVVKMQKDSELTRDMLNTDGQFYNEAFTYGDLFPFLDRNDIIKELFPKCYHGIGTYGENPSQDVVLIEDLRSSGYRLSTDRLFIDYDHIILCLRKLGRFHSLSYAAKQRDLDRFLEKVNRLKEVRYEKEQREDVNKYWSVFMERGILAVFEKRKHKDVLEKFVSALDDDPFTFTRCLVAPEEPIAVLCHGDFCRNNLLFKYEENRPVDVKFFDLATARYCSPAIDLSFFIFMNVPSEIRRNNWSDLLAAYHEGLANAIPGTRVPSLDVIRIEMQRKAAYAYAHCSSFLPIMILNEKVEFEEFAMKGQDEMEEYSRTLAGEEGTTAIANVLEDLILNKCL